VFVIAVGASALVSSGQELRLQGSAVAADALRVSLMDGFTARFGDVRLEWDAAGSGAAFVALFAGDADVGVVSRRVRADEVRLAKRLGLELCESILALDGLAIVVHPDNDVPVLSVEQIGALYRGRIVRWLGVGGVDDAVRPLSPAPSSGAHAELRELVFADAETPFATSVEHLSSSDEIIERVASDPGAIGFVSMSYDRSRVRTVPVAVDSGEVLLPSPATVVSGAYPLRYPLRLFTVTEPEDVLGHFLRFLFLHDGPALVAEAGLVPVQAFHTAMRSSSRPRDRSGVSLTRIGFGFRGSRLGAEARAQLERVASRLAESHEEVWITGHEEPIEARPDLALARAESVAGFLEEQNIDRSRMKVESRGLSEPVASNAELAGRRQNRRADVWILPH
jgi:phosphate transport system substrate-binding protein